jgi:hypothetical protein
MIPNASWLLMVGIIVTNPVDALAYIDPTAGGLLVQLVLGGIAGSGLLVKLYWSKLVERFKKGPKE